MDKTRPIMVQWIQGLRRERPPHRVSGRLPQAMVLKPQCKLRMLRACQARFIRGPQDRSPWREAGRRYLIGNLQETDRPCWNDRMTMMRTSPDRSGTCNRWRNGDDR
ncbi:MAG: hypothetical protein M0Z65_05855 [Firmicutes bacterium]|uniref:Uncharacterized protein n=1 Tax=Melghirimyces thermohalophilus TaxID=1236220 RepID=A0A1G6LMB8_9BACL|nr:hypothetical protein [Bacillota bacterium]SDC43895.1 hypothetical protein SAMN04488112_10814 [Melghirimyces thermohalophilus]